MDANEVRESVPIGDVCRVYRTRSIPGVSATIIVTIEPSGNIAKHYDLVMSKATEMARTGVFTWADHTASDIEDAAEVAMSFGFSQALMDSLRTDKLSEYVDLETELAARPRARTPSMCSGAIRFFRAASRNCLRVTFWAIMSRISSDGTNSSWIAMRPR